MSKPKAKTKRKPRQKWGPGRVDAEVREIQKRVEALERENEWLKRHQPLDPCIPD